MGIAEIVREAPALLVARTDERDGGLAERAGELRDVVEMRFEAFDIFFKLMRKTGARELELQSLLGWLGLWNRASHSVPLFNTPLRSGKRLRVKARWFLSAAVFGVRFVTENGVRIAWTRVPHDQLPVGDQPYQFVSAFLA